MAEKLSDSIRRKVKGLRKGLERQAKAAPAPRENSGDSGISAETSEPPRPADSSGAPTAKPDKKKAIPQPWYRHRQRW